MEPTYSNILKLCNGYKLWISALINQWQVLLSSQEFSWKICGQKVTNFQFFVILTWRWNWTWNCWIIYYIVTWIYDLLNICCAVKIKIWREKRRVMMMMMMFANQLRSGRQSLKVMMMMTVRGMNPKGQKKLNPTTLRVISFICISSLQWHCYLYPLKKFHQFKHILNTHQQNNSFTGICKFAKRWRYKEHNTSSKNWWK